MKIIITDSNFQDYEPEREVLNPLGLKLQKYNCRTESDLKAAGHDADIALVQFAPVTREVLQSWKKCRLIVRYGIGFDNIDIQSAAELGIQVCNVPLYCLDEVADHTCALLLAATRKVVRFHEAVKRGFWDVESLAQPMPKFSDMTVGLVGYGRIGERVAKRLLAFQFNIGVYDPYLSSADIENAGLSIFSDLPSLFSASDVISLHVPLTNSTRHLLNSDSLKWCKPNAVIVNTSRGSLLDTQAVAHALLAGRLGGVALDVFEQEPLDENDLLLQCNNALLTPHAAYYSDTSLKTLQKQAAQEVARWIKGEALTSPVNKP